MLSSSQFPLQKPPSPPSSSSMKVLPHPLLPQHPSIPLHCVIEPPQDQWAPLPMMPDKAILCYISRWSHACFHVYSFVGSLFPGSFGGSGWLILLFL